MILYYINELKNFVSLLQCWELRECLRQFLVNYRLDSIITVKFRYKDHSKLRSPSLLRRLVLVLKNAFFNVIKMGLINETCSLLRPLSTSTVGGLIIGTSLYIVVHFSMIYGYLSQKNLEMNKGLIEENRKSP